MLPLRPHQERYLAKGRILYQQGKRAILFVLPTGAGKTILACAMALNHFGQGGRVLWIVHRAELVQQAADSLRSAGVPCGIIAPWAPRTFEPVQVASIQTLIARTQVLDGISMLVIDEAHHIVADTYLAVRRQYPGALVIGLTATPGRADNRGLGNAFDSMVAEVQPRELIAAGFLVPVKVFGPRRTVDNLSAYPVDEYRLRCSGRQAIVFVSSVKQAADTATQFTLAGIPARSIDGAMDDDARADAIAAFRAKSIRVLTSVMVLTEGFDAPETSAIILARKVGSEVTYIQMTGRGMRIAPGKSDCIVCDLYGSSHDLHILPDADRVYSLDGKAVRSASGDVLDMPQCPACGTFFACHMFRGGPCPNCGWVRPSKPDPRVVEQQRIQLQYENLSRPSDANKVDFLATELAKRKGRTGGILIAFERKFHHYPNTAQRERSGFNAALKVERVAREARRSA